MSTWHGVTVRFLCPSCKRTSAENFAVETEGANPQVALQKAIQAQKLACQLCEVPLADGTAVDVHVEPGTPERLKKLGYPLPPDK